MGREGRGGLRGSDHWCVVIYLLWTALIDDGSSYMAAQLTTDSGLDITQHWQHCWHWHTLMTDVAGMALLTLVHLDL